MKGPRFSIIPAPAVTDRRLKGRDLQVLALLGCHTDKSGWCERSQVTMARDLGCGRGTVQRSISRLEGAGYLQHLAQQRDSGADAAHAYRVILRPVDDPRPHGQGSSAAGCDRTTEKVTPRDQPDVVDEIEGVPTDGRGVPILDGQGVPTLEWAPMLTTPLNEIEREARARREDRRLAELQRSYPTGPFDDPTKARDAFGLMGEEDQSAAIARLPDYLAAAAEQKRKHLPALATYLAERLWTLLPERRAAESAKPASHSPPPEPLMPIALGTPAAIAVERLAKIAAQSEPAKHPQGGYRIFEPVSPRLLALADVDGDERCWTFIGVEDVQKCAAWRDFVDRVLGPGMSAGMIRKRFDFTLNGIGPKRVGFKAPWDWPPRVDSTPPATGSPGGKGEEEAEETGDPPADSLRDGSFRESGSPRAVPPARTR